MTNNGQKGLILDRNIFGFIPILHSLSLARKQDFAAPGLCFATRHIVRLCSPDKDKLGKKQKAEKKKVPVEPQEETGLLSA